VKHPARWVASSVGVGVACIAVVLALNVGKDPRADAQHSRLVGQKVPTFDLPTATGQRVSNASLAGKTVIVNFWNSWCPPCLQELPALKAYYAQHANEPDLVLLGIARDDTEGAIRQAMKTDGIGWTVAFDPDAKAALAFATRGQPETYVIGPDGVIAASEYGAVTTGDLDTMVAAARGRA
jgi:cytochrome c biogenesis protein CcmG, thiol:disulfide interchange protein DsbE